MVGNTLKKSDVSCRPKPRSCLASFVIQERSPWQPQPIDVNPPAMPTNAINSDGVLGENENTTDVRMPPIVEGTPMQTAVALHEPLRAAEVKCFATPRSRLPPGGLWRYVDDLHMKVSKANAMAIAPRLYAAK
mmetsp:Transcript_96911/g.278358  ORF Transcript_96911/g.278358 Transcript_96911/m.278358 type:complete len:133 (+) Transcript_96911:948-1346(+)